MIILYLGTNLIDRLLIEVLISNKSYRKETQTVDNHP